MAVVAIKQRMKGEQSYPGREIVAVSGGDRGGDIEILKMRPASPVLSMTLLQKTR
jgi:hypothetical protein